MYWKIIPYSKFSFGFKFAAIFRVSRVKIGLTLDCSTNKGKPELDKNTKKT